MSRDFPKHLGSGLAELRTLNDAERRRYKGGKAGLRPKMLSRSHGHLQNTSSFSGYQIQHRSVHFCSKQTNHTRKLSSHSN